MRGKRYIRFILIYVLLGLSFTASAMKQDSIRFSLLTCSPGTEIYSLFGHTAIRYQNGSRNVDVVFNFGMFSFDAPHFLYRFVKGETDYRLGVIPYPYFESEYALRGSSVYEQELNLTGDEKQRLLSILQEHYLPENREYRYNYFYDNCTTRARDCIERALSGEVVYPDSLPNKTFRSIVHEFTKNYPWSTFGIDLCLGAQADETIGARLQMFAPFYMRDYAGGAYIVDRNGEKRKLIAEENLIIDAEPDEEISVPFLSPNVVFFLFLLVSLFVSWLQWKRKRAFWAWDTLLYLVQGLAGCVIAFLFFFSEHPTVGSNWLLIFFNPLPLLCLPYVIYCDVKRKKDIFHRVVTVYLTLFILIIPFSPQEIDLSVLSLALGFLANSISHVLIREEDK